ncbi:hypothetical protein [Chromohalobacter sp. 48-RD10]|uniref:hypothetical protein n=1 Tax=Chromohalobacter sp. 48-RD10 TaxID=2994063 RepID=UPI0024691C85|nr:hypothetical protein [Chromohalobacter sp. 48-RD10]
MIVPLFLDTNDCRHFSKDARRVVEEICTDAEPEIRSFLGDLNEDIEFGLSDGAFRYP